MTLAYDDTGAGVPVVLLHAFPLQRAMWERVPLAVDGRVRLVTPDLPGFGQSPPSPAAPSLDAYADAVADLLDAIRVEKAVVGGLSMGGYTALAFARRHPQRLLALVLADTKATADAPAAADNRRRIAAVLDGEASPRVLLDESLPHLLGATTKAQRADVVTFVRSLVEAVDPAAAAWAQRAMAARTDTIDVLCSLTLPVAVIVGDEDTLTPPADARAMAAAAPHSALTVIPGAGHLSAVESPVAFAAAIRSFVETLAR